MLAPSALAAIKQWRYRPAILNGEPIETSTMVRSLSSSIDKRGNARAVGVAPLRRSLVVAPAKKSPVRADGNYEVGHAAFARSFSRAIPFRIATEIDMNCRGSVMPTKSACL
jgi:hypothetical protein